LRQRAPTAAPQKLRRTQEKKPVSEQQRLERRKLSYKEQRELNDLPVRIEALEAEQRALHERTGSAEFYKESAEDIRRALTRVEAIEAELTDAYARWHELEDRSSHG
jgi:ATP-binding cassette subfamily F protein uup